MAPAIVTIRRYSPRIQLWAMDRRALDRPPVHGLGLDPDTLYRNPPARCSFPALIRQKILIRVTQI